MVYDKIVEIICEKMDMDADEIEMDATFESLDVDSLDMVEIVMDLEEEFDISIEDAEDLETVADLVEFIEENK